MWKMYFNYLMNQSYEGFRRVTFATFSLIAGYLFQNKSIIPYLIFQVFSLTLTKHNFP